MELIRLRTKIFGQNFDLVRAVIDALSENKELLKNKDILIVNSKIVAVSQGRVVKLASVKPSKIKKSHYGKGIEDARFVALVKQEADIMISGEMLLTIKNGIFTPAGGVDTSNTPQGTAVLWPEDAWKIASKLHKALKKEQKLAHLGIIITDSTCLPLRAGTSGVALAWAGFEGVEDVRGKKDIYGKELTVTRKAVADNLACAAQLLMGEADEKIPLVIARNAPITFTNRPIKSGSGSVSFKDCLYSELYKELK